MRSSLLRQIWLKRETTAGTFVFAETTPGTLDAPGAGVCLDLVEVPMVSLDPENIERMNHKAGVSKSPFRAGRRKMATSGQYEIANYEAADIATHLASGKPFYDFLISCDLVELGAGTAITKEAFFETKFGIAPGYTGIGFGSNPNAGYYFSFVELVGELAYKAKYGKGTLKINLEAGNIGYFDCGFDGEYIDTDHSIAEATTLENSTGWLVEATDSTHTPMTKITDGTNTIYADQSVLGLDWGPNYSERKGHQGKWGAKGKTSAKRSSQLTLNLEAITDAHDVAIMTNWENGTEIEVFYASQTNASTHAVTEESFLIYAKGQIQNPNPTDDSDELRHDITVDLTPGTSGTEGTEFAFGWYTAALI